MLLYILECVLLYLLQKELQKYGICPLRRKKAVMVLQHVFEQTHPLVTDSEAETSFSQTPQKNAGEEDLQYVPCKWCLFFLSFT